MSISPWSLGQRPDRGHMLSNRLADVVRRLKALEDSTVHSAFYSPYGSARLKSWTAIREMERADADVETMIIAARAGSR